MAAFLAAQLDFIFFFYGLAFILLGGAAFAIGRGGQEESWAMLGLFGCVHGAAEWLDLIALTIGNGPAFTAIRTAVMIASFIFLMEFARQEAIRLGWGMPGRWIYVPLVSLVALCWITDGPNTANVIARYALGLIGAAATSLVFVWRARERSGSERWMAVSAALAFGFYAVAAGAITPAAPFWPAAVFNYEWFAHTTGVPIQLVRGLLACWIAFAAWAIWEQKRILDVSSARYARYVRKQFMWTLAGMATILVSGWALTEYLGGIYRKDVEAHARGDLDLISSRLAGETAIAEVMVKLLAGAPSVHALLADGEMQGGEHLLDLALEASGAELGYILDRRGTVIAASGSREGAVSALPALGTTPYFQKSITGEAGYHFAFDAARGGRAFYASYPIRAAAGEVAGVAVLKKSLDGFESDLRLYDRAFFLIDPNGIVVLTNRPEMMLRAMWPLSPETQLSLAQQYGQLNYRPMMEQEIADATWTLVDGVRDYVRRRYTTHSRWSLVILKATEEIFASRVLGIAITLLTTIMALIYLLGRERAMHDHVQMDKRMELQELASDLRFRATTDPLTGLNNRLRFNEAAALEMSRSQRYRAPLSLVLFDIDHFKKINDSYGHLVGDQVLIQLSRFVAGKVRTVDVLARWGGEEFAILLPECNDQMACLFAEKLRGLIGDTVFDEAGRVTCSFGIAQFKDGDTAATLFSRADKALYQAKINGRNRVELVTQRAGVKPSAESAA